MIAHHVMTIMCTKMTSNYKFDTLPDEVAKDPTQHGNYGKLFSREGIERNGNEPCTNCRAETHSSLQIGKVSQNM